MLTHQLKYQMRRMSSKSALFVSGRVASKQFAVFTPDTEFAWVKENRETLKKVYEERQSAVQIDKMIAELDLYADIKRQVDERTKSRDIINQQIKESKSKGGDLNIVLLNRLKENKKTLKLQKETLWDFEENLILDLLQLQNCDSKSRIENKIYFTQTDNPSETVAKKGHRELAEINDLVEFSNNSHTGFYLKHELARLELQLNRYFNSKLLDQDWEIFSNPDFSRSVVVEGCGEDFMNPHSIFSLKKTQDFGDRTSCNAMHLLGGASLSPFLAYFARNILTNPHILPIKAFCLGRSYSPQPQSSSDLFKTQQSQGLQLFNVSSSQESMEEELEIMLECIKDLLSVFPNFTMTEQKLADCRTCNSRQYRVTMQGVEPVDVGHVGVQGKYLSQRVMMVGHDTGGYIPLYTVSANLNITRMLGVLMEMVQDNEGRVDCNKIANWLQ